MCTHICIAQCVSLTHQVSLNPLTSASKMSLIFISNKVAIPKTESYSCPRLNCSFEGTSRESLRSHDRVHKKQLPLLTPIQCHFPGCSYRTSQNKHLQQHLLNRHNPNRPKFKCHLCEKFLSTKSTLELHTRRHTGEMLPCSICDFMTTNPYALGLHIRRHELGNRGIEWLKPPNTHKCQLCGYLAPSKARVMMHARVHSAEKVFKCSVPGCSHTTKWKGNLQQHEDRHDPIKSKRFKCPLCPKRFCTEYQVTRHVRTHTQERPRECPDCSYKAATLVQVKRHQLRHHLSGGLKYPSRELKEEHVENSRNELNLTTETRPSLREGLRPVKIGPSDYYKYLQDLQSKTLIKLPEKATKRVIISKREECELGSAKIKEENGSGKICAVCGFNAKCPSHLATHMRVHLEDKPLKCRFPRCEFATKWDKSIIEHVKRLHTPKHYSCPYIGCSFSSTNTAISKKHRDLHKLPFKKTINCPICPRKYASMNGVNSHLLSHTGEKAHQCNLCVYASTNRTHLKLHVARIHRKQ